MSDINLKQDQRLLQKLTPIQIQYLALLHLPILQLEDKIQAEIEQNPLLEEVSNDKTSDDINDNLKKEENNDKITVEDIIDNEENDYFENNSIYGSANRNEFQIQNIVSITDEIFNQLKLNNSSEIELTIANEILGNLEANGYLKRDLSLIINDLKLRENLFVTNNEVENVLFKIQHSEPRGIGSRNLKECLLVQLENLKIDDKTKSLAKTIIETEYDDFLKKHVEVISKKLQIPLIEIKDAINVILHLNPKPGNGIETDTNSYIIPDFIVHNNEGELVINLNNKNIPPLRINNAYKNILMDKKNKNDEAKIFVKSKIESAKNFILAIEQRNNTMISIMGAIVDKQKDYFLNNGPLKPLIYNDLTRIVFKDKSTISRVVSNKFVQTDFGIFPLRYFFSESIQLNSGEVISNKEVKNVLIDIIKNEDVNKPYSDDKLVVLLGEKGITVARRTITKYRDLLNIPVARLRKKI